LLRCTPNDSARCSEFGKEAQQVSPFRVPFPRTP